MLRKLLVADDSVTIQKVVQLAFAEEEIEIETAGNGDAAIERIRNNRPDVLLADIFMPGRSGYELCETIKSDPELSSIRVVLLVGTFEPSDEAEAARVGCDSYLTKPFDTSELLDVVHSLIDRGGQKAQLQAKPAAPPAPSRAAPQPQPAQRIAPPQPAARPAAAAPPPQDVPVRSHHVQPSPVLEDLRDAAVIALGGPIEPPPSPPAKDEALEALADESALDAALSLRGTSTSAPVPEPREEHPPQSTPEPPGPARPEPMPDAATAAAAHAESRDGEPLPWTNPPSGLISERTRESFLGGAPILDLFGGSEVSVPSSADAASSPGDTTGAEAPISDAALDALAEKVARRLSAGVVREVALAIVPKIAEAAVERYLRDRG